MKPRLFSGIQPSGNLHLGNYFGMLKNAAKLQNKYQSIFCIVDLHAITIKQDPETLRKNTLQTAKHFLASGIDPEKSILFIQSSVSEHAELCWILNTLTKTAEMERMTQFKDKARKNKQNINLGLMSYPVLMAADILLYDTAIVPVGQDQSQHLELARILAKRFNKQYRKKVFTIPKPLIKKRIQGSRLMGLDDPTKKMSKSAPSPNNYIALNDPPKLAAQKIMRATTDSGDQIKTGQKKPGITNLLSIYSLLTHTDGATLEKKFQNKGYGQFKKELSQVVSQFLANYQKKFQKIDDNSAAQILAQGAKKAKEIASQKIIQVKKIVGLA